MVGGVEVRGAAESEGGGGISGSKSVTVGLGSSRDGSSVCGEGVNVGLLVGLGSQVPRSGGSAADIEHGVGAGTGMVKAGNRGDESV